MSLTTLLPDSTHLGAVRLQVSNLERSLDYYQGVLGLQIAQQDTDRASLVAVDGGRPLVHLETHPGVHRASGRRVGLYHFALLVPDRATLGRFVSHLVQTRSRLASADHAVSEAIYLWDPDGLGIEVYVDRPRASWRRNGDELYMTSEALDLGGLVDAAGDTPWSGMPQGTVLGHMHLHVGDLARADDLYHAALGLDRTVWSYPGALFLAAAGYHHHLGLNTWAGDAPLRAEDEAGLIEWEILLPQHDAQAAAVRLERVSRVEVDGSTYRAADFWGSTVCLVGSAA